MLLLGIITVDDIIDVIQEAYGRYVADAWGLIKKNLLDSTLLESIKCDYLG